MFPGSKDVITGSGIGKNFEIIHIDLLMTESNIKKIVISGILDQLSSNIEL